MSNWLEAVQTVFNETRKMFVEHKRTIEHQNDISNAITLRDVYEQNYGEQVSNLESSITNKYHRETVLRELDLISKTFEEAQSAHSKLIVLKKGDENGSLKIWYTKMYTDLGRVNKLVHTYLHDSIETKPSVTKNSELNKMEEPKIIESRNARIVMEKIPLPKFGGNVRMYPRFIKDFRELVMPNLRSVEAPFTLRQCLSESVNLQLGACEDDLSEMLSRLDEIFANPNKLIDCIISEIQKFRKIDVDDNKRIISFVDIIDRGYRDLCKVKLDQEICNSHIIGIIEGKLPKNLQSDWYRYIHKKKVKINEKFPELLEFLRIERSALEYGMSDLRSYSERKPWGQVNTLEYGMSDLRSYSERKPWGQVNTIKKPDLTGNCLIHNEATHSTSNCMTYTAMTVAERYELLKKIFACFCCLVRNHRIEHCPQKKECGDGCTKLHHPSLHPPTKNGSSACVDGGSSCSFMNENLDNADKTVILPIMKVKCGQNRFINVLWDTAANLSLITKEKAKLMKLEGKPVELSVTVAGGMKNKIDSEIFIVPLIDKNGCERRVVAYGIEKITTQISQEKEEHLSRIFPTLNLHDVSRPTGEIDLLIGYEYAGWHPVKEHSDGHLLILSNQFGKCFGGSHQCIREGTQKIVNNASVINMIYKNGVSSDFFALESLGTNCEPLCGSCKCGKCPVGGKPFTIKEERELKQIENGLSFHGDHWEASYPWGKDPNLLPNNYDFALKLLKNTENRLKRDPDWQSKYSEQIMDMVHRKVARKLNEEELKSYAGPIHYIAHHAVVKAESKSTPVRIVFNSSANYNGHVLNDYWVKGPDAFMNNLLGVLLRFRENYVGIAGDIRKMYNSVQISTLDQHCHRFLWRDMESFRPPDIYVITAVNIGDKPSGTIATVALRKTADLKKDEYPKEANIITNSSYVDDIVDSVNSYEEACKTTSNIENILKLGNFHIKSWTISKDPEVQFEKTLLNDDHEKVLGVCWIPGTDKLKFNCRINFSKKIRGVHTGPDLKMIDIPEKLPPLTKRLILSQINGIYDPLGLITPFIVNAKIQLRKLWASEPKIDWDDVLPHSLVQDWVTFFRESFLLENLMFDRCVKPQNAVGTPTLVFFSDASKEAFGACVYLRWKLSDNSYKSNLLISKSRIAPMKCMTIVNLELSAAVLACRLRKFIERECRFKICQFIHIVDSEIVRSMIQKESYGFNTFVANRVGEVQRVSNPKEWYWVEGNLNIADIMTRGVRPNELGSSSRWQIGPDFLRLPFDEWPVRSEVVTTDPPDMAKTAMPVLKEKDSHLIDVGRFSSYNKFINTTARILSLKNKTPSYSLSQIGEEVTSHGYHSAELYWVEKVQSEILPDLKLAMDGKGRYKRLSLKKRDDGIYVVGKRVEVWNEMSYDGLSTPLLPRNHRLSKLYAEMVHKSEHLGVATDVAKIRTKFWIVAVESIVKSIRYHCIPCRKRDKKFASQVMAPLPQDRLKPAPVWSSTGIDLFGPFQIRGEVNKRSSGKCYGIIFTCMLVRAVHLEVAADYSTESFLMAFRRFTAIRGYPHKVYSDGGSQLVGASSELKAVIKQLDWKQIKAFGANKNLEWIFSPGDSPWYNGCCESLIKSIKKSIHHAVGQNRLGYSELHTVLFEISNVINERPIGKKPTQSEESSYLCPNDMLLGRCSAKLPYQNFDDGASTRKRFLFLQQLVDAYWKKWTTYYFPSLIIQSKWHHDKRNMLVGDVVLIQDSNNLRGQWKMGKIVAANPGVDGKIRRVSVQYNLAGHCSSTVIERSVQRLVLIIPVDEVTS